MKFARTFMQHSLKFKLMLPALLIGSVMAGISIWGIYAAFQQQLYSQIRHRAELIGNAVNYAAEGVSGPGELQRIVSTMGAERDVDLITVVGDHPTRVLATTHDAWRGKTLLELPDQELIEDLEEAIQGSGSKGHAHFGTTEFDFVSRLLLSQPTLADRTLADGALVVRLDMHGTQAELGHLTLAFSLATLAVLAILSAFGYWLINRVVLHPVARIGELITHHYDGSEANWTQVNTLDEIGRLAGTLRDSLVRTDAALHDLEHQRNLLRNSEARYHSTFADSSVVKLLMDSVSGSIVDANQAACAYYGWTLAELLTMNIKQINTLGGDDVQAVLQQAFTRQKNRFNLQHRLASGEVRDVEVYSSPVAASDGEAAKLLYVIVHDVTDRNTAQRQLGAAEQRFRGLIEQSLAGIYVMQNEVFQYANPHLEHLLGYAPGELVGKRIDDLAVAEDLPILQAEQDKLLAGAASLSCVVRARRKDGSVISVAIQGSRVEFDGAPAIIGMAQDITEKMRAEDDIKRYVAQLENAFMSPVEVATSLSELRDPYTAGHERRVGKLAAAIGAELGWDERRQEGLRVAGYLHDIGKITIPAQILSKPGKLSAIEYKLIQEHAQVGYDVLKKVHFPWPVADVALQHHERLDGSGYPQGLKGDAIRIEARIMTVADVVEAISSHRPYRPGLGIEAALAEIERGRATQYDTAAVDACLRLFRNKGYSIPD